RQPFGGPVLWRHRSSSSLGGEDRVSAVTSDALIFEHDTLARATGGRWEGLFNRIVVVLSALVLGVIVVCAIFAPWLAPHNPNTIHLLDPYANPSHTYLFGQDSA